MDDSLVSEGTMARARAGAQLVRAVGRAEPRASRPSTSDEEKIGADENNSATPHRLTRVRAEGEQKLHDLNERASLLEAAARALRSPKRREDAERETRKSDACNTENANGASAHLEKWRAIQTWASVDSVEASANWPRLSRDTNAASRYKEDLPNLPETLSPITQVAEPRRDFGGDDFEASADDGTAIRFEFDDDDANATGATDDPHPEWATPLPVVNAKRASQIDIGSRSSIADATDKFHSFPFNDATRRNASDGRHSASGGVTHQPHANASHPTTSYMELEVTRRREREARDAIDKMDRAAVRLREERDAAVERSANDRQALARISQREKDASEEVPRLTTLLTELKQKLNSANARIETLQFSLEAGDAKHNRRFAEAEESRRAEIDALKTKLCEEKTQREKDATKATTEKEHARRASAALAASAAEEKARADALAKTCALTKQALEKVSDAAGAQLSKLREEVTVLKARLSAQQTRDSDNDSMRAELVTLKETVTRSVSGIDGTVATALRRAHDALVGATRNGPGCFDVSNQSTADRVNKVQGKARGEAKALSNQITECSNQDTEDARETTSTSDVMDASLAELVASKCFELAETLADKLDDCSEKEADLTRRLLSCVAFEEGADGVRLAMEAANKKTEDAVREKNEHLAELSSFRRRAETAERAIDAAYAETASACKKARVAEASRDASTSEANDRAEDAKNQLRSVTKKLKVYETELIDLKTRLRETTETLTTATAAALDFAKKLSVLEKEVSKQSTTAVDATGVAEAMRVRVESARREIESLTETLAAGETALADLRTEKKTLADQLLVTQTTVQTLRDELTAVNEKFTETNESLLAKSDRVKEMRDTVADGVRREAELEKKIDSLETSLCAAVAETEQALRREKHALLQIGECEQSLKNAEHSRDELMEMLEHARMDASESQRKQELNLVASELQVLRQRESKTRDAFAGLLSTLDHCVAGAFSKHTATPPWEFELQSVGGYLEGGDSSDDANAEFSSEELRVPTAPDFSALTPVSLAPPTGCTLDHGVACKGALGDRGETCDDEGDACEPSTSDESTILSSELFAAAAEARGTWAARQLKARVGQLVGVRDVSLSLVRDMRVKMLTMQASVNAATEKSLANEARVAEALEVASAAKAVSAKAHAKMKAHSKLVLEAAAETENESKSHKEKCDLVVNAMAANVSDLELRCNTLEERLDDAQTAAAAAVAEAYESSVAKTAAEESLASANQKVAEMTASLTKLQAELDDFTEKSDTETSRLTAAALDAEAKAEEAVAVSDSYEQTVARLTADVAVAFENEKLLKSVVADGAKTVDALLRQRNSLRAAVSKNATVVTRASARIACARASRRVAQREVFVSRKNHGAISARLLKAEYALVTERATRVSAAGALAKEREKSKGTCALLLEAQQQRDSAVGAENEAKENAQRAQVRLERQRERAAIAGKTSEARVASAEAAAKTARSDAASAIASAKAETNRAKQLTEKASDAKRKARADLSAANAALSELQLKLAAAEATAAAAAAAAMSARGDLETQTESRKLVVDSEHEALRNALRNALLAKDVAERKLATDVAQLEKDVLSLKSRRGDEIRKENSNSPASPTPSVDAANALFSLDPGATCGVAGSSHGSGATKEDADLSMALSDECDMSMEARRDAETEELVCLRAEALSLRETNSSSLASAEAALDEKDKAETLWLSAKQETDRLTQRVVHLEQALTDAKTAMALFEENMSLFSSGVHDEAAYDRYSPTPEKTRRLHETVSRSPENLGVGGLGDAGGAGASEYAYSPVLTGLLGTSPVPGKARHVPKAGSPAPGDLRTIHEEGCEVSVEALSLELSAASLEVNSLKLTLAETTDRYNKCDKARRAALRAGEQLALDAETAEAKVAGAEDVAKSALLRAERLDTDFDRFKASHAELVHELNEKASAGFSEKAKELGLVESSLATLTEERDILHERCLALQGDLFAARTEGTDAHKKLRVAESELERLAEELTQVSFKSLVPSAVGSFDEQLKVTALTHSIATLEFQLAEHQTKLLAMTSASETTAREWAEALGLLEGEKQVLEAEKTTLSASVESLETKVETLESKVANSTAANELLTAEKRDLEDTLFPTKPVVVQLSFNESTPDQNPAAEEIARAAERSVLAARDDANAARDERDLLREELGDASLQLEDALQKITTNCTAYELKLAVVQTKLGAAIAEGVEFGEKLHEARRNLSEQVTATELAEESVRESVVAVGSEMRRTAQVTAEASALREHLRVALDDLASAEAAADGRFANGGDGEKTQNSSADTLAALRTELTVRRVREATLETDAARLRQALDDSESRVFKLEASAEAAAAKSQVLATSADTDLELEKTLRQSLADTQASVDNLRDVLCAKELVLRDVTQKARTCAEQAEASTKRADAAEIAAEAKKTVEVKIVVNDATAHDGSVNTTPMDTARFATVVDSWRTAVANKTAEIEAVTKALQTKTLELEELSVSAANGSTIRKRLSSKLKNSESEIAKAAAALSFALLDVAPDDASQKDKKHAPLGTLVEAAIARLDFLKKHAESELSSTEKLIAADEKSTAADCAALAAAELRTHDFETRIEALQKALQVADSARSDAEADMQVVTEALDLAKQDLEKTQEQIEKLRFENDSVRSARHAADMALAVKHKNEQGGQAKVLMLQAEAAGLRGKVEKRNREVRELNQMLKAWEAMRHSKDSQIAQLVERCRKFELDAAEKARAVDSLRARVGREPGSGTPTSLTRSIGSAMSTGLSVRSGSGPGNGFASSSRRGLGVSNGASLEEKENPNSRESSKQFEQKSVSPASASLAAFKRNGVPRADAVPGFRERLDMVTKEMR